MKKNPLKAVMAEKMLYSLFLDLYYAAEGYNDRVCDLMADLKDSKKLKQKADKSLEAVTKRYTELTGSAPPPPRRG